MPYLTFSELQKQKEKSFDFIVVGAGSAGCPLASRLSEDRSITVLLVEAADANATYKNLEDRIPVRAKTNKNSSLLMYNRGHAQDYNDWDDKTTDDNDKTAKGGYWNWNDTIGPLFQERIENTAECIPQLLCARCRRGGSNSNSSGPLGISHRTPPSALAVAFLSSAKQLGFAPGDYNCSCFQSNNNNKGVVGLHQQMVRQGTRCNATRAYIDPLVRQDKERPNLFVVTGTKCQEINLMKQAQGDLTAIGVELVGTEDQNKNKNKNSATSNNNNPTAIQVTCTKEVILSAGALGSPQILLQSGLGPKGSVLDMSQVGQHLQQHISVPLRCVVAPAKDSTTSQLQRRQQQQEYYQEIRTANRAALGKEGWFVYLSNLLSMLLYHAGIYTSNTHDASIFYNSNNYANTNTKKNNKNNNRPDAQISIMLAGSTLGMDEKQQDGSSPKKAKTEDGVFLLLCTLLHPKSRGYLESNGTVHNPEYLEEPEDVQSLVEILKLAYRLTTVGPLGDLLGGSGGHLVLDNSNNNKSNLSDSNDKDKDENIPDDAFWKDYIIRHHEQGSMGLNLLRHSPVGTCRMGKDSAEGVVDHNLRVHGVKNLRVADASIQPEIVSGDITASSIAIGERAADIIRKEYRLQSDPLALLDAVDKYEAGIQRRRYILALLAVVVFSMVVAAIITVGFWKYQHRSLLWWDLDGATGDGVCEEPSRNSMAMFPY